MKSSNGISVGSRIKVIIPTQSNFYEVRRDLQCDDERATEYIENFSKHFDDKTVYKVDNILLIRRFCFNVIDNNGVLRSVPLCLISSKNL